MHTRSETRKKTISSIKRTDIHSVSQDELIQERFILLMIRLIENELKFSIDLNSNSYRFKTKNSTFESLYQWVNVLASSAGLKVQLIIKNGNGIKDLEIKYYAELDNISSDYVAIDYILRKKGKMKLLLLGLLKAVSNIFGFNNIYDIHEMYEETFIDEYDEIEEEKIKKITEKSIDQDVNTIKKYFNCLSKLKLNLNLTKEFFVKNFDSEEADIVLDLYYAICSLYVNDNNKTYSRIENPLLYYYYSNSDTEVVTSESRIIIGIGNDSIMPIIDCVLYTGDYTEVLPIEACSYITEFTPDNKIVPMKNLTKKIRIYQAYESFRELLKRRENNLLVNRL